jgi:hypothetical protein
MPQKQQVLASWWDGGTIDTGKFGGTLSAAGAVSTGSIDCDAEFFS